MKVITSFVKQGTEIKVGVMNKKLAIDINGVVTTDVTTLRHKDHGWYYETKGKAVQDWLGRNQISLVDTSAEKIKSKVKEVISEIEASELSKIDNSEKYKLVHNYKRSFIFGKNDDNSFFNEICENIKKQRIQHNEIAELLNVEYEAIEYSDDVNLILTFAKLKKLNDYLDNKNKETEKVKRKIKLENDKKFEQAMNSNQPVELYRYTVDCNDDAEACDADTIITYAMPDGTTRTERCHNW